MLRCRLKGPVLLITHPPDAISIESALKELYEDICVRECEWAPLRECGIYGVIWIISAVGERRAGAGGRGRERKNNPFVKTTRQAQHFVKTARQAQHCRRQSIDNTRINPFPPPPPMMIGDVPLRYYEINVDEISNSTRRLRSGCLNFNLYKRALGIY